MWLRPPAIIQIRLLKGTVLGAQVDRSIEMFHFDSAIVSYGPTPDLLPFFWGKFSQRIHSTKCMKIINTKQNIPPSIFQQPNCLETDNKHKSGMYWNLISFKNAFWGILSLIRVQLEF